MADPGSPDLDPAWATAENDRSSLSGDLDGSLHSLLSPVTAQPPARGAGSLTWQMVLASVLAALGGVLFGYDVGIISGAILQLEREFSLSCLQRELVVAGVCMGALVASVVGGFLVDGLGRKTTIIVNAGIFIIGTLILTCAQSFPVLICGRLIIGFAVALCAIAECVYLSEIAQSRRRGQLVSFNELGITLGFLVAYLINYVFIRWQSGWHYMFGLSGVFALLQGVGMILLPESPRYLLIRNKPHQAKSSLQKFRGSDLIETEIGEISAAIAVTKRQTTCDLFRSEDNMRFRILLAMGLVFFQQITGQPSVLYYAPTIFESVGFHTDQGATLATVGLGVVKLLATSLVLLCVDRAGRRRFLVAGALLMMVSIMTLGLAVRLLPSDARLPCDPHETFSVPLPHNHSHIKTREAVSKHTAFNLSKLPSRQLTRLLHPHTLSLGDAQYTSDEAVKMQNLDGVYTTTIMQENMSSISVNGMSQMYTLIRINSSSGLQQTTSNMLVEPPTQHSNKQTAAAKWTALVALMLYVTGYAISFGPVSWLVLSEIFPTALKGRAMALATVGNWGTNLLVSFTFLDVMSAVGVMWTFLGYGLVCGLSVLYILALVPETRKRSLEEISQQLNTQACGDNCLTRCLCCRISQHPTRYRQVLVNADQDDAV